MGSNNSVSPSQSGVPGTNTADNQTSDSRTGQVKPGTNINTSTLNNTILGTNTDQSTSYTYSSEQPQCTAMGSNNSVSPSRSGVPGTNTADNQTSDGCAETVEPRDNVAILSPPHTTETDEDLLMPPETGHPYYNTDTFFKDQHSPDKEFQAQIAPNQQST